jgi:hypothetical protein
MERNQSGDARTVHATADVGCCGSNLARAFNLRPAITVFPFLPWAGDSQFAITKLKSSAGLGVTKITLEAALLVSVAVEAIPRGQYQYGSTAKNLSAWTFRRMVL